MGYGKLGLTALCVLPVGIADPALVEEACCLLIGLHRQRLGIGAAVLRTVLDVLPVLAVHGAAPLEALLSGTAGDRDIQLHLVSRRCGNAAGRLPGDLQLAGIHHLKADALGGIHHSRQDRCDLAAADGARGVAVVGGIAALQDTRAVELVDGCRLRVGHRYVGDGVIIDLIDLSQRAVACKQTRFGNSARKDLHVACARSVLRPVIVLRDDLIRLGVIHIRLIPRAAGGKLRAAGRNLPVHTGGKFDSLGIGEVLIGRIGRNARAGDKPLRHCGFHIFVVPCRFRHIGKAGRRQRGGSQSQHHHKAQHQRPESFAFSLFHKTPLKNFSKFTFSHSSG